MTILVAYAPRPEGNSALQKGIELAKERNVRLLVINASRGDSGEDSALADSGEIERIEKLLADSGVDAQFKQFVRGKDVVSEIEELVSSHDVELVVIGLRRRSAVGKLLLGSVAQDILMTVPCPVLAVKAY
jgi:nucleotide-binding universal stress UspA family protein